jgi:hypothetical protein
MDWLLPPGNGVNLPEAGFVGSFVLKILFLLAFLLYTIFAFVVIRQVRLMEKTYHTSLNLFLTIFAWAHFFVAVAVLVFAFIVL